MITPAARYFDAEAEYIAAEHAIESLLDALYSDWSSFECTSGGIDIFDAFDGVACAVALFRAGFRFVRCHSHSATAYTKCACAARHPEDIAT